MARFIRELIYLIHSKKMVRSTSILTRGIFTIVLIFFMSLFFINYVNAACSNPGYANDFDSSTLPVTTSGSPTVSGGVWVGGGRQGVDTAYGNTFTFVTRMRSSSITSEYAKITPFSAVTDDHVIRYDFIGGNDLRVTNWWSDCSASYPPLVSNVANEWHQYTVEMNNGATKIWQDSTLIFGPFTYACTVALDDDPGIGSFTSAVNFDYFYVYDGVDCGPGYVCGAGYYDNSGAGCLAVGAGYYSPAGDNSRYQCAAGYYCSTTTNSASTGNGACSAGYYGSSTGQTAATCNGACTAGYYCTAGSTSATQNACGTGKYCPTGSSGTTNCAAGYYGSSTTNSVSTCNGACTAGYYCTAGSTSATQNACGAGKYCPAGSSGTTNCAAGYYGSSTTNSVSTCNGACTAGYYCTAGSTSATQNACGTGNYCPAASGSATVCPAGTYGSTTTLTTSSCTGQCSAGYYGSSTGQTAATCNGACTAGYYCTAGSTSATQNTCSNKPLNSNYNSTSGTNSCGFSCAGNLESKFGCATAGNNTNIHFLNNVSSYSNLTLKVGSKIYLNNSNLTISQLILDGSGDKIIINSGSYLIINGSN